MGAPQTALVDEVTELLIIWPHLAAALERDQGAAEAEKVSGSGGMFGLPVNADVLQALHIMESAVPALASWAAEIVVEPFVGRSVEGHLRHLPRFHERMLVTAAVTEAAHLAARVHNLTRMVKSAIGLRTADRPLGHPCPRHDDPISPLIIPGDEGVLQYRRLDREGQPIAPAVEWRRTDRALCHHCGESWAPSQYLFLGRLLREAQQRRDEAAAEAEAAR